MTASSTRWTSSAVVLLALGWTSVGEAWADCPTTTDPDSGALFIGPCDAGTDAAVAAAEAFLLGGALPDFFEDFEAGNAVVSNAARITVAGTDSIETVAGPYGASLFTITGPLGITIQVAPCEDGSYPSTVGLIATDGNSGAGIEATGADGVDLGSMEGTFFDGSHIGTRPEDRLLGVYYEGGIDEIRAYAFGGGLEVDHVQWLCGETNNAPEAHCEDVVLSADQTCSVGADIDDGSFDPDGDEITLTQSPAGPYTLGETVVTLTVSDGDLTDTCEATVTVIDDTDPIIDCGLDSVEEITPPDAGGDGISFTATATDDCSTPAVAITGYTCWAYNGAGQIIDKTGSCEVAIAGDTITILDSGGVGDHIVWTAATDGITATCEIEVVNPGKGKRHDHPNK